MIVLVSSNKVLSEGVAIIQADGVAPYTYELLPNGDGGSVSVDGVYTAPKIISKGLQVVRVTDSNSDSEDVTFYILNHLQLLCEIIKNFMGLSEDQIYIYNQKFKIPPDNRVYVAVKLDSEKPFANNVSSNDGIEYHSVNFLSTVTINLVGFTREVLDRKDEVLMAIRGSRSQLIQTSYGFKIARMPSNVVDLSEIEGSAIPFRFNITLNMFYAKSKSNNIDFYDSFDKEILITE